MTKRANSLYINVGELCDSVRKAPVYPGQCSSLWSSITDCQDLCLLRDNHHVGMGGDRTVWPTVFLSEPGSGGSRLPTGCSLPSGTHALILKLNSLNKEWLTLRLVLITYLLTICVKSGCLVSGSNSVVELPKLLLSLRLAFCCCT